MGSEKSRHDEYNKMPRVKPISAALAVPGAKVSPDDREIEARDEKCQQQALERAGGRCESCEASGLEVFAHQTIGGYVNRVFSPTMLGPESYIALCRDCGKIYNRCKGQRASDGTPNDVLKLFRRKK